MSESVFINDIERVDPGELNTSNIWLHENDDGKIHFMRPDDGPNREGYREIKGGGLIAVSGFTDIHTHGADDGRFYEGGPDEVVTAFEAKIREGVTTVLPTTMTQSKKDLEKAFEGIAEGVGRMDGRINVPGIHVEGPYLSKHKIGAQKAENLRLPDIEEIQNLQDIYPISKVSLAPELPGAVELIKYLYENGIVTSFAHTNATESEIQQVMSQLPDDVIIHLTHTGNAMTPMAHRGTGVVGMAFDPEYSNVYPEMIADGVHLSDSFMRSVYAANPDHAMLITDSIHASHRPVDGTKYDLAGRELAVSENEEGYLEARLTDKTNDLAGSVARYPEVLQRFMKATGLGIEDVIAATSLNQAGSFGWKKKGRIAQGMDADITLLDKKTLEPAYTIVGGQIVCEQEQ